MALKPCYECGRNISEFSLSCPQCGAPASQISFKKVSGSDSLNDQPCKKNEFLPERILKTSWFFSSKGSISRMEYFWSIVFLLLVGWVFGQFLNYIFESLERQCGWQERYLCKNIIFSVNVLVGIPFVLCSIVVFLNLTIKRLHDMAKSGYFVLLTFLPLIGFFVMIWIMLAKGKRNIPEVNI